MGEIGLVSSDGIMRLCGANVGGRLDEGLGHMMVRFISMIHFHSNINMFSEHTVFDGGVKQSIRLISFLGDEHGCVRRVCFEVVSYCGKLSSLTTPPSPNFLLGRKKACSLTVVGRWS